MPKIISSTDVSFGLSSSTGNIISFSEKKNGIESKEIDQKGKIVRKHFFEY